MKIENIDVNATIEEASKLLEQEKDIQPALKNTFKVIIILIKILVDRITLNSKNSSKPPSSDPNRKKKSRKAKGKRKPGGQPGRVWKTLQKVENPDKIEEIKIDRRTLPKGEYKEVGFESRQVVDIKISRLVTEYRAQILEDQNGNQYVASFPEHATRPVQYGVSVKVNAVYMSQYQLIPYDRIKDYFVSQLKIPLSVGSIYNFNKAAYDGLESFEVWVKKQLISSEVLHADETGINIGGQRFWLHCNSTPSFTYLYPHARRGVDAMNEGGVLPVFNGILCHDHWKPYYSFCCVHSLCNAHHLRELERAWEQDRQQWAQKMQTLLLDINKAVTNVGDMLSRQMIKKYRTKYRKILKEADKECPPPPELTEKKKKRGKQPRSKARNLLERLRDFEDDVLRFMETDSVPFTNNQGENDLRMTKVQQKISGCFRSLEGAKFFCRIRSYLSTCRKHHILPNEALTLLF